MAPFFVLLGVTAGLLALRYVPRVAGPSPAGALRGGLAVMFTVTGVSHFVGMRDAMVAMVPPALPSPELLVTVTGVLELAGAAGLLLPRLWPFAAAGLTVLLVLMFPANVYAAVAGVDIGGEPAMALLPRALLQLAYLAATATVLMAALRQRRRRLTARAVRHRTMVGAER